MPDLMPLRTLLKSSQNIYSHEANAQEPLHVAMASRQHWPAQFATQCSWNTQQVAPLAGDTQKPDNGCTSALKVASCDGAVAAAAVAAAAVAAAVAAAAVAVVEASAVAAVAAAAAEQQVPQPAGADVQRQQLHAGYEPQPQHVVAAPCSGQGTAHKLDAVLEGGDLNANAARTDESGCYSNGGELQP
jgi:hypothetical protein